MMYMPSPPSEAETALVHLPPKRPLSSPSPEPRDRIPKRSKQHCPFNYPDCDGCPSSHNKKRNHATPLSVHERKHHALLFWRTMASISGIPPGKAHMVQLQQTFIDSYFSMGVVSSHRQYFNIFYWLSPQSAAMSASRDALCMIHIGSRRRNFELVHEGQRRHVAAMGFLRQDLARPGAVEDDAVLGANYTLGQAEVFMAVSRTNPQYMTHMAGLQQLLLKRGPESMKSPFAKALLYNIRSVSVMHGLLQRKPLFLTEKRWMDAGKNGWQGEVTISVELTDLSLQIPGLLQCADAMTAMSKTKKKAGEFEIVQLLTELSTLEVAIQKWLLKFYRLTRAEKSPYRLSSISNYPFLHAGCGGLAHVFPSMIDFPAFLSATTHVWVWTCLLIIRQTILDVAALHPYPIVRAQNQKATLEVTIDECAVNLCSSIAYLIHPNHASNGIVACGPALHFSALWFERQGHTQRLIWARHVREFLQRDVLLGGGYDSSINIDRPMFVWWMLPDIVADDQNSEAGGAGKVIEVVDNSNG